MALLITISELIDILIQKGRQASFPAAPLRTDWPGGWFLLRHFLPLRFFDGLAVLLVVFILRLLLLRIVSHLLLQGKSDLFWSFLLEGQSAAVVLILQPILGGLIAARPHAVDNCHNFHDSLLRVLLPHPIENLSPEHEIRFQRRLAISPLSNFLHHFSAMSVIGEKVE